MIEDKKVNLLELFLTFLKIGVTTFGGGYAMIPIMQRECVEKKGWISEAEIIEMLAISESTPGVLSVNAATYIGYKKRKFLGALLATLGVILPAFLIILIISIFLTKYLDNEYVRAAFKGISAGVSVLIFSSAFKLFKKSKKNWFGIIIMLAIIVVSVLTDFSVIYLLLISAVLGIIYGFIFHVKIDNDNNDKTEKIKDNNEEVDDNAS